MITITEEKLFATFQQRYNRLFQKDFFNTLSFSRRLEEAGDLREELFQHDLYQYRREMDAFSLPAGRTQKNNGSLKVNLASNDYLGFTHHPEIIAAGKEALQHMGAGSGSVPMLAGTFSIHKKLEKRIASFTGYEAAISFNSGYGANYGLLSTLLTPQDAAILDTRVHASIIDGCRHTRIFFFNHNDTDSLESALKKAEAFHNKLVIVDGIYSMEGDEAPLAPVIEKARNHGAWVMVDESHSIGVMGKQGRGTQEHQDIRDKADITSASMGKALGGIGGYVTGPAGLISLLELTCRSFIFSASLPPANAAASHKAFELLENGDESLTRLWENIDYFKKGIREAGFDFGHSVSAILPIRVKEDKKLMDLTRILFEKGIMVNPVYYPVVPRRKSLIRVSVSARLTKQQMDFALDQFSLHSRLLGIL